MNNELNTRGYPPHRQKHPLSTMVLEIYLYKKQLAGSDACIESEIGEKNEFSCTIFACLGAKSSVPVAED